jgi:hypothetical protein
MSYGDIRKGPAGAGPADINIQKFSRFIIAFDGEKNKWAR